MFNDFSWPTLKNTTRLQWRYEKKKDLVGIHHSYDPGTKAALQNRVVADKNASNRHSVVFSLMVNNKEWLYIHGKNWIGTTNVTR